MNFGLEKQLDRIVETLALSALLQASPEEINDETIAKWRIKNKKVEKRLNEIAFPLEIDFDTDDPNIIFSKTYQEAIYCECGDEDCEGGCDDIFASEVDDDLL